jgi:hypothetical protein
MMPREVTDTDGTTWSCTQLYAALSDEAAAQAAAERAADAPDHVAVVCTPSGGAQSVRVELPTDWEEGADDQAIVVAIGAARAS